MSSNLPNFFKGLQIMGFGMAGIFIVLLLIFAAIKVLIKLFPAESKK
ncbi:MAG: hypothetical protein LIR50_02370 [Bacillota bacterium]|nr:hypothetical protein [Bacillota bacterium]